MKRFFRKKCDDDLAIYRAGYPGKKDDPNAVKNLQFYRCEIPFTPNGEFIDVIHRTWFGRCVCDPQLFVAGKAHKGGEVTLIVQCHA